MSARVWSSGRRVPVLFYSVGIISSHFRYAAFDTSAAAAASNVDFVDRLVSVLNKLFNYMKHVAIWSINSNYLVEDRERDTGDFVYSSNYA